MITDMLQRPAGDAQGVDAAREQRGGPHELRMVVADRAVEQRAELLVVPAHPLNNGYIYMYAFGHQWATATQVLRNISYGGYSYGPNSYGLNSYGCARSRTPCRAHPSLQALVMAVEVMAYILMADIVVAYIVMAYIVVAVQGAEFLVVLAHPFEH